MAYTIEIKEKKEKSDFQKKEKEHLVDEIKAAKAALKSVVISCLKEG